MEIERKWLVETLPQHIRDGMESGGYMHRQIVQGYLCTDPVLRVRQDGNSYYLTYKGKGRLAREEHELPLNEQACASLLKKCDGIILKKERYVIPLEDEPEPACGGKDPGVRELEIELDIFRDDYDGLIYAEVEFCSEEEAKAFEAPSWFGREVTYEKGYSNAALSRKYPGNRDLMN